MIGAPQWHFFLPLWGDTWAMVCLLPSRPLWPWGNKKDQGGAQWKGSQNGGFRMSQAEDTVWEVGEQLSIRPAGQESRQGVRVKEHQGACISQLGLL